MATKTYGMGAGMWGPGIPAEYMAVFDELYLTFDGSRSVHLGAGFDAELIYAELGLDVTLNYEFGFGLLADIALNTGEIEVAYQFDPMATKSMKLDTINQKSWVDTSNYLVTAAAISTTGLHLEESHLYVDLAANFEGSVDVNLSAAAGIDLIIEELEASASAGFTIDLPTISAGVELVSMDFGDGEKTFSGDYGSLTFALPTGTAQSSDTLLADPGDGLANVSTSQVSDPFAIVSVDFVAVAAALCGIPPEVFSGAIDESILGFFIDLEYTVLSEVLSENASLRQDFTFDATGVAVTMVSKFGPTYKIDGFTETVTGQIGDKFEFATPEGEGTFKVTATYELLGTLTLEHYIHLTTSYVVTMLEASVEAGIDFADITSISLGPVGFGPLMQEGIEGLPIDIKFLEVSTPYSLGITEETYYIQWEKFYTGTVGADNFVFTTHQPSASGDTGNDKLTGNTLANTIFGDGGNDTLRGGDGNDTLDGGLGRDALYGDDGMDSLYGGAREDTLYGGDGRDLLDGGASSDTASYAGMSQGVVADFQATQNNTNSARGDTYVSIENLTGTSHNDTLSGNRGGNVIDGGDGDDVLWGRLGRDTLTGGAGNDVFRFNSSSEGGDQVTDFAAGDRVALKASAFGLDALVDGQNFVGGAGAAATAAVATVLFDTSTAQLLWDADGTGPAAPVLLATITGAALAVTDVVLA
ncbi:MAG: hypothetical protein HY854_26145 [Burkholderiales bacterium]|nr:hypothetical protein [Burkholderiales bacterium]